MREYLQVDENKNIERYKKIAMEYVDTLVEIGIPVERAYVFGSRIKGTERPESDLDTCIVSSVFGVDSIADRVVLMKIGRLVNKLIEPHPVSTVDFASKFNAFANEVKNTTVREAKIVPKGSYVLNTRQVTVTSTSETLLVAQALGIEEITPQDLMSNVHLEGIPFLSGIPPGNYMVFFDPQRAQRQLVLFVTGVMIHVKSLEGESRKEREVVPLVLKGKPTTEEV